MTDLYSEWRDFYTEKVHSWMSLEELRVGCGKLQTVDNPSPEVLLIHAMHALEECEQRDKALLQQALEALSRARQTAMEQTLKARIPECAEFAGIAQDLDFVVAALRERLGRCSTMQRMTAMSEVKPVTVEHAREALEDMDDYARMDAGVDAKGPRETLERFIAEHERVVAEALIDAERYRALRELLRRDPAAPWTPQELAAFRITQWVTGFKQETLDRALDAVIAARGAKENGHE